MPTGRSYIGTTKNLRTRMSAHRRKPPSAMRADVQQHGQLNNSNITITVLVRTTSNRTAESLQRQFISARMPYNNTVVGAPRMHRWVHAHAKALRQKKQTTVAVGHIDLTGDDKTHC